MIHKSSCPEVLCKKGLLKHFAKFTGKHLCQGLIFNKVAGPISSECLMIYRRAKNCLAEKMGTEKLFE